MNLPQPQPTAEQTDTPANVPAVAKETDNYFASILSPTGKDEAWKLCQSIANSGLCPKNYQGKPFDVAIAASLGRRMGLDPITAMQGIAVVNGQPKLYGDVMWGVIMGRPDFEDVVETCDEGANGEWVWKVQIKRRGRTTRLCTFSKADAKAAGLLGKAGPWSQYERRMGQWRARTLAARDAYADVLSGFAGDIDESAHAKPVKAESVHTDRFSDEAESA